MRYVTRASDDQDLWRLSKRHLLVRLVRTLDRMETFMSASSDYITAALDSLDVQMSNLQIRLTGDAQALKDAQDALATALANDASDAAAIQEAQAQLSAAADRIQATAVVASNLAQPSVAADPSDPPPVTPVEPVTDGGDPAAPVEPTA